MLQKSKLLFHTLKYLRFKQLYYQVYYRLKNGYFKKSYHQKAPQSADLNWNSPVWSANSWYKNNSFIFLNLEKSFISINWNYTGYGKLWTYNLTYFEFLNQEQITPEEGLYLIRDFIQKEKELNDALEPYPISLRGMNWIKFLSRYKVGDQKINTCLYNHYNRLYDNIEYHLMGNHLMENGFSLLFAGLYFKEEKFHKRAERILRTELKEQILADGAHFELSPMYHQIILHRLLDCINLLDKNEPKQKNLLDLLQSKATDMLGWLQAITFKNGNIPMVNDSAFGVAPSSEELYNYAKMMGLKWIPNQLKESGYRKWATDLYECFLDVSKIGPDYIPGHAHADTLNFELYVRGLPFIVEVGTSTYEKNELRQLERGTKSHNTIVVNNTNQSEVWGGFRVARRVKNISLVENPDGYSASHDGYKRWGIIHKRTFKFKDKEIRIQDRLIGNSFDNMAYFHFHPSVDDFFIETNVVHCKQMGSELKFLGDQVKLEMGSYMYAAGFNKRLKGNVIQVSFSDELTTIISNSTT